jgi:ATP-dependent protease ClpP protease subunit
MPKEIYLYNSIYEFVAEQINKELSENPEQDYDIRMDTTGGYTSSGAAMLTKMAEHQGKIRIFVDGNAYSMGAFMLLFADEVIVSEMSSIMFHKAAYSRWYDPTDAEKAELKNLNTLYEAKMMDRLGSAGVDLIAKVFEPDVRNDEYLTPDMAVNIGLASRKISVETTKVAAVLERMGFATEKPQAVKESSQIDNNNNDMTEAEVNAKIDAAIKAEQDRVGTWMVYIDVDKQAVIAGIESGNVMSEKAKAEMSLKMAASQKLADHKDDSAGETDTSNTPPADPEAEKKARQEALKERIKAQIKL